MTAAQRATLEEMLAEALESMDAYFFTEEAVDALRAALGTCGTCQHIDDTTETHGQCVPPTGLWVDTRYPFAYKAMPLGERCSGWEARDA